ncbi:MAG TPA: hypothetical protein DCE23_04320 [Firmicutes bacterium]|nr:hypothetical protein [Bacillota bacterium]
MYIKKKSRELFKNLDRYLKLPGKFNQYVNQIEISHRLIKKNKNNCYCDNCGHIFNSTEVSINERYNCPNCKKELLVRSNRLKKLRQRDEFCILNRYKEYWIIRAFDIETWYQDGEYNSHVCEYCRQIYNEHLSLEYEIYNKNIVCTTSGKHISHKCFLDNNWKVNQSYYHQMGDYYKVFPYNLKRVLKESKWQYSQIWEFAKKNQDYVCLVDILKNYNNSFELLVKMKLYNLALDSVSINHAATNIKSMYDTIRKHLNFIKKHNLNFDQLTALDYVKNENIKIIDCLSESNIQDYELLKKFNIDYTYVLSVSDVIEEYFDYLDMCQKLQYNLKDKKIKYPKEMLVEHDKLIDLIEVLEDKQNSVSINKRYNRIKKNEFHSKKYKIYPVSSVGELVDESRQQNNCVKTYAERIAEGKCDIYFMRLVDNPRKSLVTVEVRNNKIVQKRTKNNERTTKEQDKFLNMWERKILGGNS